MRPALVMQNLRARCGGSEFALYWLMLSTLNLMGLGNPASIKAHPKNHLAHRDQTALFSGFRSCPRPLPRRLN